ncbi:MAG TPA: molybdopterin converting factor subunit 1 [Aggregatilineaceae bacterium]|nr:molybdopterin converting factor subunit 1 [Aggregatilineaceae bacterium]
MNITVRFFASLRDTTGTSQCTPDIPEGATVADLVHRLLVDYPALEGHQSSWHFAVNQTHVEQDTALYPGDRVAIFPYVAGG